jgi:hypothetical protein
MAAWKAALQWFPRLTIMKTKVFTLIALALPAFAETGIMDALAKHWKASGSSRLVL